MAVKLTNDEIEALIKSMWSLTMDDNGVPFEGQTQQGQMALEIVSKIVGAAIVLHIKPEAEIVSLDAFRQAGD
jgi:hypothetical protein